MRHKVFIKISSNIPYVAFLSHVFRKFKLDLTSESRVVKVFEPLDRSVLHRMKLLDIPSPPPQSSTQVPQSSTQPPPTQPPAS